MQRLRVWLLFAVIAFSQQLPPPGWRAANKEGIQCPLLVQHGAADGHPAMAPHQGQLTLLSPCPPSGSPTPKPGPDRGAAGAVPLGVLLLPARRRWTRACAIAVPKSSQKGRGQPPWDPAPRPRPLKVCEGNRQGWSSRDSHVCWSFWC